MIGTLGYPSLLPVGGFGDLGPEHTFLIMKFIIFVTNKSVLRGCATSHGLSKIFAWLKVMTNGTVCLEVVPGLMTKGMATKFILCLVPHTLVTHTSIICNLSPRSNIT